METLIYIKQFPIPQNNSILKPPMRKEIPPKKESLKHLFPKMISNMLEMSWGTSEAERPQTQGEAKAKAKQGWKLIYKLWATLTGMVPQNST